MNNNIKVFLLLICALEIIYATGYPTNKHIIVDDPAKTIDLKNTFNYIKRKVWFL